MFADEGIIRTPVLLRRVDDSDGKVLYEEKGKSERAISEASAFLMSSMLADVVNSGTAYRVRQSGFTLPAAGKTGTTNDYVDAWFVGYTPHLVTGVWVGFDQPKTIVPNGYAADLAVPIWASFMKVATKGAKPDWYERPSNVVGVNVCRVSGKLPNAGCYNVTSADEFGNLESKSMVYTDYFVKGTQPTTTCPVHGGNDYIGVLAGASPSALPGVVSPAAPPAPQGTTGSVTPVPAPTGGTVENAQPKPDKKRGFWGKLFGKKDTKESKDTKDPKDPKKPGGGGGA